MLFLLAILMYAGDYYRYDDKPRLTDTPLHKDYTDKRDAYSAWLTLENKKPVLDRDFNKIKHGRDEVTRAWKKLNKWMLQFKCRDPKPWRL